MVIVFYGRAPQNIILSFSRIVDANGESQSLHISTRSQWDSISDQLKTSERPVVLHRTGATNSANPFASTFCYGYQDIIFEVFAMFLQSRHPFLIRHIWRSLIS